MSATIARSGDLLRLLPAGIVAAVVLAVVTLPPAVAQQNPPPVQPPTQYWIYAGQSNLAGFAGLREVVQQHLPEVQIKEIRSGIPGTPIQSWLKGDPWQQRDKTGWKILLDGLKRKGQGRIAGMVWYQGESNTGEDAAQYQARLKTLIADVRRETGLPNLPVIIVQLATCRRGEWGWATVREAQRRVAVDDPRVEVVCALDLEIGDNIVHLSSVAKAEIGRRQGLAALRLVYGQDDVTHGPQFARAFFGDSTRQTVVVQMRDVAGRLKLTDGWRQGFAAVEAAIDSDQPPPLRESLIWPRHAEVIADDQVALVFGEPLPASARIGWGMTPSACIGPHRSWDMPIAGLTDATGIAAIAFSQAAIDPTPKGSELARPTAAQSPPAAKLFDPRGPFQIAVNGIGRSRTGQLAPGDEAGAPGLRQKYWNGVNSGLESHLLDAQGRRTPIGVHTSCWYANFVGDDDTADARLMGSYNRDRDTPTHIVGLLPEQKYDIVLYHNIPDHEVKQTQYSVGAPVIDKKGRIKSVEAQQSVTIAQPVGAAGAENPHSFVKYIEATEENDFTGNWYIFRGIAADDSGSISIWPRSPVKGGRPRFTALQIVYRGDAAHPTR